ncbi:MAG: 6-phosphogluconolactonase [Planctomycetota bacterium]
MIQTFDDLSGLSAAAADTFCQLATEAIGQRGLFHVSLSGGSTPRRLYELLRERELPWNDIRWYWGDERHVPHDHADSNYAMVRAALLDHLPTDQVHAFGVPTQSGDPVEVASAYEAMLREQFSDQDMPQWDLALLGLGDDAHTASLFPGTDAITETERWFVSNFVPKFDAYRFTLTAPAINSARQRLFLVSGAAKQAAMQHAVSGVPDDVNTYPSQLIRDAQWYATRDAWTG